MPLQAIGTLDRMTLTQLLLNIFAAINFSIFCCMFILQIVDVMYTDVEKQYNISNYCIFISKQYNIPYNSIHYEIIHNNKPEGIEFFT